MISHSLSKRKICMQKRIDNLTHGSHLSCQIITFMAFLFTRPLLTYWITIFVDLLCIKHLPRKSIYLQTFGTTYISLHEHNQLLKLFSLLIIVLNKSHSHFKLYISKPFRGEFYIPAYLFWIH